MKHTDSFSRHDQQSDRPVIRDLVKGLNYEGSFEKAQDWLVSTGAANQETKPERRVTKMKEFFLTKKVRIAYAAVLLAITVAACNYPVTSNETAGDVVSWKVNSQNNQAIDAIRALPWIKNGNLRLVAKVDKINESLFYTLALPQEHHGSIANYMKQLEGIEGVSDIRRTELNQTVKRPVYSVLLQNLFKIDINATNLSDEELKSEVSRQLQNAGISGAEVLVERNGDSRSVKIKFDENTAPREGGFDMTITDGQNVERIKQFGKKAEAGKFDGKTDEEIRRMVREDFPDGDIRDEEISIIREGGKVKVKVVKERTDK